MVRCYGKHYLKQFIKGKPIRFGFKQWVINCTKTGCCFNKNLYEVGEFPAGGLGAFEIVKNIKLVEIPSNHSFYFDNFFTSFELLKTLAEQEVCAFRTIRLSRLKKFPLKSEK